MNSMNSEQGDYYSRNKLQRQKTVFFVSNAFVKNKWKWKHTVKTNSKFKQLDVCRS